MKTTTNKPIAKVRFGAVIVAIWENESESGPWHNVTLTRIFRDKKSGKLRDSGTLSGGDILAASEALRQAYLLINNLRRGQTA